MFGTAIAVAATSTVAATVSVPATSTIATTVVEAIESLMATSVPSVIASMLPSEIITTAPLAASQVQVPAYFEIAAVIAGGLAGAAKAAEKRFDVMGVLTLAIVNGLGGGIIRDVLLQTHGIYAFQNPGMLVAAVGAGAFGFFFAGLPGRVRPLLWILDTASLSLFVLVGVDKALRANLGIVPAILLGMITAVGGGLIRDVLCNEVPQPLRPGALSGLAAMAGSTTYVLLGGWLNIVKPLAVTAAIAVVVALRVLSRLRGWQTPTSVDLTPAVSGAPRLVVRRLGGWVRVEKKPDRRTTGDCPASSEPDDDAGTTRP
ncbi:MAG: trimeric intracellular cation channel family protein [Coriobacteriia bacterium]